LREEIAALRARLNALTTLPLSLDPPANSGRSFSVRFLPEEFSGVNPGAVVLPLACSAACPGSLLGVSGGVVPGGAGPVRLR